MKKKLPRFKSDKEAEEFVAKADLTQYDLSGMRPIRFEFQPKSKRVNMRLPANSSTPCGPPQPRPEFLISASSARRWRIRCSANVREKIADFVARLPATPTTSPVTLPDSRSGAFLRYSTPG